MVPSMNRKILNSSQQKLRVASATFVFVLLTLTYHFSANTSTSAGVVEENISPKSASPRDQASNSTLGFQKILALSSSPSWRTRGLEAAAGIAGLQIDVPRQPFISDEMVKAYMEIGSMDQNKKRPSLGSAKAWLAHLDLIKFAIASDLDSVLIIEDDCDWDVTIREEMAMLSDAIRLFQESPSVDLSPYGTTWDVLWIGHCGEVTEKETPRHEYEDVTLMPEALYAGWSKKWLYNVKNGHRAIQRTRQTVCTFGYGLSRRGLSKVSRTLGVGQNEAFDIALSAACREGRLDCMTINPELMHHYNPKDGTGYVSPNDEANGGRHSSSENVFEDLKGTTANMKNSARCAALFHETCPQPPLG